MRSDAAGDRSSGTREGAHAALLSENSNGYIFAEATSANGKISDEAMRTRDAAIGFAAGVGMCQNVLAIHLVVQCVEPIPRFFLRFGMQCRL